MPVTEFQIKSGREKLIPSKVKKQIAKEIKDKKELTKTRIQMVIDFARQNAEEFRQCATNDKEKQYAEDSTTDIDAVENLIKRAPLFLEACGKAKALLSVGRSYRTQAMENECWNYLNEVIRQF